MGANRVRQKGAQNRVTRAPLSRRHYLKVAKESNDRFFLYDASERGVAPSMLLRRVATREGDARDGGERDGGERNGGDLRVLGAAHGVVHAEGSNSMLKYSFFLAASGVKCRRTKAAARVVFACESSVPRSKRWTARELSAGAVTWSMVSRAAGAAGASAHRYTATSSVPCSGCCRVLAAGEAHATPSHDAQD